MITGEDIGRAFWLASGLDPMRAPKPNTDEELDGIVTAWRMFFEDYPLLTGDDLMQAVKMHYRKPGVSFPLPGDLRVLASEVRRDRLAREPLNGPTRAAHEALCDSKAEWDGDEPQRQLEVKVNNDPATAEHRRKMIEAFVAAKSERAAVPPADS